MPRFVLTKAAKDDLKSIGRYTQATWGPDQRNRYLRLLDAGFHTLADNPLMGTDCGDIRPGYRKHRVGKHLVFYRQSGTDEIEIVRVLHQGMDVPGSMSDP
ncbi:type II toxin-antitoxin system RelE/ParE family toxin [uncultured Thiodictyon sp.]|jgi:toxin ParE1/3/4|uniref:type II toxin-antitoxin system RelE/ParE family toxin n=1 Tax=uncultured Thiodictyon sp. TaxID=1846217 RepID=UPI0025F0D180|nr:type II toxin-antitoxin system RelE/ParE family toxin [uncultured Thiodictyon sp.]